MWNPIGISTGSPRRLPKGNHAGPLQASLQVTWLAISFAERPAVNSGLGMFLAHGILGTQESGRRRRRNSEKALPAFAGSVFGVF